MMRKVLWAAVAIALLLPVGAYAADTLTVDNLDAGYAELSGTWFGSTWGYQDSSRWCVRDTTPFATARWTPTMTTADKYNVYYILPSTENASTNAKYVIVHSAGRDSVYKNQNKASGSWVFLGAYDFAVGTSGYVEAVNDTDVTAAGWAFRADAALWEAVGDTQDIHCVYFYHDFGIVPIDSTEDWTFDISNVGGDNLVVDSVITTTAEFTVTNPAFPQTLIPGATLDITVRFAPTTGGNYADTVEIYSNDPDTSEWVRTVALVGQSGQLIVDDDDAGYSELLGTWVDGDGGYNGNHRAAIRSTNPMATAQWTPTVVDSATYNVFFWLTHTSNAATNAKYVIVHAAGRDSVYRDQNRGTGDYWIFLGQYIFDDGTLGYVQAVNDTNVTSSGYVIRADAVKLESPANNPDIHFIDYSHDFGEVTQNTSSDWVFTVHNIGAVNLTVDSIMTSNPAFTVPSPATPAVVPPAGALDITVRFTPTTQGSYSGQSVTVYNDDPGEPARSVLLSGEGVGALVYVDNSHGAPRYTEQGTHWATSSSNGVHDSCYTDSRYNESPRDTSESATWRPNITVADCYDIYWMIVNTDWTDANALYVIHPSVGPEDSIRVNQQFAGSSWHYLGTAYFDTDNSGYVMLVNDSLCTGPVVRADCIKFMQSAGDVVPPNDVTDLMAQKSKNHIGLTWTPSFDMCSGVDHYIIFRNTTPGFTPQASDSIGSSTEASYVDSNAAGTVGTNYYYFIQAVDGAGNKSGFSNHVGEFDKTLNNSK
jgi:hypothetical protein